MANEQVVINPVGDKVTILHGNVNVYQFDGEQHTLLSTQSLIDLVKSRGSRENTVVFYNDQQVQVVLNDRITDRPKDYGLYNFPRSPYFQEWMNVLEHPLSQKDFVRFLKNRPETEIDELEALLANVQKLKIATEIIGEYENDGNDITFFFKAKDKTEGKGKLPTVIEANLELINESGYVIPVQYELEIKKPKSEEDKPYFVLTCEKFKRYWRDAVDYEVDKLKAGLEGYLILSGKTVEK